MQSLWWARRRESPRICQGRRDYKKLLYQECWRVSRTGGLVVIMCCEALGSC